MKRRRRNSGADFAWVRTSFNSEHRAAQSRLPSRVVVPMQVKAAHGLKDDQLNDLPDTVGGKILKHRPATVDDLFKQFCKSFKGDPSF